MKLTRIQEQALVAILEANGEMVRGGYDHPINSGTGNSLVGHGLAYHQEGGRGIPRGNYFGLTDEGEQLARRLQAARA